MKAEDVIRLLGRLGENALDVWIDGGWAVDALLGRETRPHDDLDVVVEDRDVERLRELLAEDGYRPVPREDTSPWNFVLGDDAGRKVDVHVIVLDAHGDGRYGPSEQEAVFPAASLVGTGTIAGRAVRCISAEFMVRFMAPWQDVRGEPYAKAIAALCEAYGLERPPRNV